LDVYFLAEFKTKHTVLYSEEEGYKLVMHLL